MNDEDNKTREQELTEERIQLEEALNEVEQRYQALIETNLYGIQEIDIYGNITFMNSIQYQILGYEEGELKGNQIWDLLATDSDRNELTDYLTKIALGEFAPFPWVGRYVRKDGETLELQIDWKCRWGSQDTVTGFVSIISDILNKNVPLTHFQAGKGHETNLSDGTDIGAAPHNNLDLLEEYLKTEAGSDPDFIPALTEEETDDAMPLNLSGIRTQLEHLHEEFQSKLKYDAHKDRMIDKLHKELQDYKGDILKKYLKSVIMDIIQTIDNTRKLTDHYGSQDSSEIDPAKLLSLLESIPSDLEDLFYRQGINTYTCEGDTFDAVRQKVLKTYETSDKSKDRTVAENLRPGYEWEDKVIRPEMVAVYMYKNED